YGQIVRGCGHSRIDRRRAPGSRPRHSVSKTHRAYSAAPAFDRRVGRKRARSGRRVPCHQLGISRAQSRSAEETEDHRRDKNGCCRSQKSSETHSLVQEKRFGDAQNFFSHWRRSGKPKTCGFRKTFQWYAEGPNMKTATYPSRVEVTLEQYMKSGSVLPVWDDRRSFDCFCGAPKCIGRIDRYVVPVPADPNIRDVRMGTLDRRGRAMFACRKFLKGELIERAPVIQ